MDDDLDLTPEQEQKIRDAYGPEGVEVFRTNINLLHEQYPEFFEVDTPPEAE